MVTGVCAWAKGALDTLGVFRGEIFWGDSPLSQCLLHEDGNWAARRFDFNELGILRKASNARRRTGLSAGQLCFDELLRSVKVLFVRHCRLMSEFTVNCQNLSRLIFAK